MNISSEWLVCNQPNPSAKIKLYCFPYAGAGSMIFRTWTESLPDWIELWAIQLPGREWRFKEKPFTSMQEITGDLGKILVNNIEKPFAFFGHSMGAWLAFELARYLRKTTSLLPTNLFVSARFAPHLPIPHDLGNLKDEDLIESVKSFQGIPEEILKKPHLIKLLIPILRADLCVCETYKYIEELPLECPISIFGGQYDHTIEYNGLKAWTQHTTNTSRIEIFPGDHFFLRTNQTQLINSIISDLEKTNYSDPLHQNKKQ